MKRALLLSLAIHGLFAFVFPLMNWAPDNQFRSGEILTLSRVQRMSITHRAHAVASRDLQHKATQLKTNVLIVPHIAHAALKAAPVRYKPVLARRMEAPAAVVAAVAHPQTAQTAPSVGNLAETPAPLDSAAASPSAEQPKQIAAAPTTPPRQEVGAGIGWGINEASVLIDEKRVIAYLKSKLGRAFHLKIHVAENGKATEVQFITPNIDERLQQEIRAMLLAEVHFAAPQTKDGVPYDDWMDLPPK